MLQVAPRVWPAAAVHDTVEAVVSGPAFHRSLQNSVAERLFQWLNELFTRLSHLLQGAPSARTLALGAVALLVLLVVARLVVAAQAREPESHGPSRAGAAVGSDPWAEAERLAAAGRYEDAAHALYRGVLTGLSRTERLRLDPAKTSGDYARELRRRGSPALQSFRAFVRRFDVAVYGHGGCTAESIDELRRLAVPFAPAARAA